MTIAELFIKLGVDVDQKGLNNIKDSISGISKSATLTAAALAGTLFAIERLTSGTIKSAIEMKNFNQQTGLSIEELQRWQAVAVQSSSGLSIDEITSSVKALQDSLTDTRLGGSGKSGILALLGITSFGNKDAFQILDDVREQIKGLDDAVATNLLQKLGLNPKMISILRLSNEEFEKLSKKDFLSEEQIRIITELGVAINNLRFDLGLIKDKAIADLSPALMGLVGLIRSLSELAVSASFGFKKLYASLQENEFLFSRLKVLFLAFAIVIAPVQTAIVALILAMDDLNTYLQGGESLIGNTIEEIMKWKNALDSLLVPYEKLLSIMKNLNPFFAGANLASSVGFSSQGASNNSISKTANVNNTFNINSNQDARDLAQSIIDQEQKSLNHALDDTNNGGL